MYLISQIIIANIDIINNYFIKKYKNYIAYLKKIN